MYACATKINRGNPKTAHRQASEQSELKFNIDSMEVKTHKDILVERHPENEEIWDRKRNSTETQGIIYPMPASDVSILKFESMGTNSLQNVNFTGCSLGKKAIEAISHNSKLRALKYLNLSENPVGNDGIKFIAETSHWVELAALHLSTIQIDHEGVKYLAMNESWRSLKTLDLSYNPQIGDLGAINLSLNRTWMKLEKLLLCESNVKALGFKSLRRNKRYRVLLTEENDANRNLISNSIKHSKLPGGDSFEIIHNPRNMKNESLIDPPHTYPICHFQRSYDAILRGGFPPNEGDDNANLNHSELRTKFQHYKEKILHSTSLERELNLYVEVSAVSDSVHYFEKNKKSRKQKNDSESSGEESEHSEEDADIMEESHDKATIDDCFELSFDIWKSFLNSESAGASKVLLLTGQTGTGKTVFCKFLQREILSSWRENTESERYWLPIYIDLLRLKNLKADAITETLSRELSLTKEEIDSLQNSTQSSLPRLLFIFDGYDTLQDGRGFQALESWQELIDHNFFVANAISSEIWKEAKFIITCRKENLQGIQRTDLLFAPLHGNGEAADKSVVQGSFLHRKLEPFSDEQITCYLKKYSYFERLDVLEEKEERTGEFANSSETSWELATKFEKMIDSFGLRDLARVPFFLWIMCQVLPKIANTKADGQNNDENDSQPAKVVLSSRFLIDFFVDEAIRSIVKKQLAASESSENQNENGRNQQVEDRIKQKRQQMQHLALKLGGYSLNTSADDDGVTDDPSAFRLLPFIEWDGQSDRIKFSYPFLFEFFVAKGIEEEINELIPSDTDEQPKVSKQLLINQRHLSNAGSDAIITLFLRDAIKDEILSSDKLLNLIYLSRKPESDQEITDKKTQGTSPSNLTSPFTVAAVNAIMILNVASYDFNDSDLSNINIPGANLSYGIFEGTDFTNANLEGVDFTEACLANAILLKANMKDVKFTETPPLNFAGKMIQDLGFSANGRYFAVTAHGQTIIYENTSIRGFAMKEIRRLPGMFLDWEGNPFSPDEKQIITVTRPSKSVDDEYSHEEGSDPKDGPKEEKGTITIRIWGVRTGNLVEKFTVAMENKVFLRFNPYEREVIASEGAEIRKYNVSSASWDSLPPKPRETKEEEKNKGKDENQENDNEFEYDDEDGVEDLEDDDGDHIWDFYLGGITLKCTLNLKSNKLLLVGSNKGSKVLRNSKTWKPIMKYRQRGDSFKFTTDGKQIIFDNGRGTALISDCLRGHFVKHLVTEGALDSTNTKSQYAYSFGVSEKQIAAIKIDSYYTSSSPGSKFLLEDATGGKIISSVPVNTCFEDQNFSIFPDGERIALLSFKDTIYFNKLPVLCDSFDQTRAACTIQGSNTKGLNLKGVIANACFDLPVESLPLFQDKGSYAEFDVNMMKNLFDHSEHSKRVGRIILLNNELSIRHARIIGSDLHWTNLKTLDLSQNTVGEKGGKVIASNTSWPNLSELNLIGTKIGDKTAKLLANNQTWKKLRILRLGFNKIGNLGASEIGKSKILVNLEHLELRRNQIEDEGAMEIGNNNIWTNLAFLDLGFNKIHDKNTLLLFCYNSSWKGLKFLFLESNPVTLEDKEIIKVVEDNLSRPLESLILPGARFEQMWLPLLKAAEPNNIIEVKFERKEINDIHGILIGNNKNWTNLRKLLLPRNAITDVGGVIIGSNTTWVNLEELDLTGNKLKESSGVAIGANQCWKNLRVLNLDENFIGVAGACAIGENLTWSNLQELYLRGNAIQADGAARISQNPTWTNLQTLELGGNLLGDEGIIALAKNTTWTNLKILRLRGNSIGAKGIAALRKVRTWANLQVLDLRINILGVDGAAELSKNETWPELVELNLGMNALGDEGAIELSKNVTWTKLQKLYIGYNTIRSHIEFPRKKVWPERIEIDLN